MSIPYVPVRLLLHVLLLPHNAGAPERRKVRARARVLCKQLCGCLFIVRRFCTSLENVVNTFLRPSAPLFTDAECKTNALHAVGPRPCRRCSLRGNTSVGGHHTEVSLDLSW